MKFVYVASPYTKGDTAINVRRNLEAADQLAKVGYVPFAPLLTHFWHLLFPHPYEFWCKLDDAWVEKCCCLVRLTGDSSGADKEVALAESKGIPVYHCHGEFDIADFNKWAEGRRYCAVTGADQNKSLYQQAAESSARSAERVATPAENLRIMAARLSLVMSPAEKREVEEAAALLEPSAPSSGGVAPEVRLNNDGTLDEVCTPLFHLEQMDYNHWFLEIVHGGQAVAVWLHAKGKITASYEHRRTERGDQL